MMIADGSYSGSIVSILNVSCDVSRCSIHDYCYLEMYRDTIFMIYPDMYHDTVPLSVSSRFVLRSVFLRLHARFSVSLVCVGDPDDEEYHEALLGYREARDLMKEARVARGFYPVVVPIRFRQAHWQRKR